MGQIVDITEDNIDDLRDYLGEDIAENIGREYYAGIASYDDDDEPAGAVVWNIRHADSMEDTESEIVCFKGDASGISEDDEEDELLTEYYLRISCDCAVRSVFELEDTSETDRRILRETGFSGAMTEGQNVYTTLGEARAKSFASGKVPSYVIPLEKLNLLQFRQGITNCMFCGVSGLNDDLAMLPMEWYETGISCCTVADGKVNGIFLVHRKPSGILMPVLMYASGLDAKKEMLLMLRFSTQAAAEKYPDDTVILICRHDKKTRDLTSYIFPDQKGKEVFKGERWEGDRE
ncbi:MAG: hypothetical protein J5509_00715 [Lachnospiraceae bacterium]|nr:hypothetical protein [Lachnospiraceae bacterium]